MTEVEKPEIRRIDDGSDPKYGAFTVEPLNRGYGITLGNSLRRILLSSLPGTAVTSVRIDGVLHEFSVIPGVLEDTADIILNLKRLALRLWSDEPHILRIEKEGPGEVVAGDIIADADVDILEPDQHIAYVDEGHSLRMELTIERGRGYVSAEKNKRADQAIGVIPVDSIFSPVTKVNWRVEDTRVGHITDYDRLTLEVWTDGSLSPEEAISRGAKILSDHLRLFIELTDTVSGVEIGVQRDEDSRDRLLEMPIEELDLSVRSFNCLKRAGINTVGELTNKSDEDMMKVRNLGKKSLEEVKEKLVALGLGLRPSDE
ncbi:DNA-directed RNA polymerase subunit alpha [Sulfobacillus thermosulfidooxidans]|nr:DNA-directed RNA polymerase subunit alpha [Sulfobacillus thermosulfidooxidans]OLZ11015.1 DNA-directed RNA polymerase subunit alpha [Sulfobacillus thermosulfidooxidans]OLZ14539.1 DNA-directed RNA polymerase subunit alpha [Sulfobacillus thermosulfidooxidans]OLZ19266.1 DNA-directed RNA polymerase subunit alpha [Sulfobacillus thermosulfidooxidans]PSR28632.1 MAG: DNA-directed RNA polymerase subunit alpha [Sulfobacillus thermosulfidooxidans]